jgi:ATP adenylyltransferase
MNCPFCEMPDGRIIKKFDHFYIIRDAYPVSKHHTLIISDDHNATLDSMTSEQSLELIDTIKVSKKQILEMDNSVTGFNIGINEGIDAGQTVMHFHCHVIPRRNGDNANPRGGVRGVIPNKQSY